AGYFLLHTSRYESKTPLEFGTGECSDVLELAELGPYKNASVVEGNVEAPFLSRLDEQATVDLYLELVAYALADRFDEGLSVGKDRVCRGEINIVLSPYRLTVRSADAI